MFLSLILLLGCEKNEHLDVVQILNYDFKESVIVFDDSNNFIEFIVESNDEEMLNTYKNSLLNFELKLLDSKDAKNVLQNVNSETETETEHSISLKTDIHLTINDRQLIKNANGKTIGYTFVSKKNQRITKEVLRA